MILDERIFNELKDKHRRMLSEGKLPTERALKQYYATFRANFGPEQLANLDGVALLEKVHGRGTKDSLVYWLEFKNDDEFPFLFGSISGGIATKFGIFLSRDTGEWTKGGEGNSLVSIPVEEAIEVTRQQRDQLLRGVEILSKFPENATDDEYRWLQQQMDEQAPDVSNLAWGHKYFSLLFPTKLDDYHKPEYQRFHLAKLLHAPTEEGGRYVVAGRFVAIAQELGMPLNHLSTILNSRNGRPHGYWRIAVSTEDKVYWDEMRENGFVAPGTGWIKLPDLSVTMEGRSFVKEKLQQLMVDAYADPGRWTNELYKFLERLQVGDIVLAFHRNKVLGIGKVKGVYGYTGSSMIPHRRSVEWLSADEWELPIQEAAGAVVKELKYYANYAAIERHILDSDFSPAPVPVTETPTPAQQHVRLDGIPGSIQRVLERKKQVILYGPPGTGKTFWAELTACELSAYNCFGLPFDRLSAAQQKSIVGNTVRICSFHPAYGYEDFLQGYRPKQVNNQMVFVLEDGIFKKLCQDAVQQPDTHFYLLIDEINRGDIPRIFGELLTVLEQDKRGKAILLPLNGESFHVPPNVYLIGTMNTADRSIALLDAALRRRFGFIELMPDTTTLGDTIIEGIPLGLWLEALNHAILESVGHDARNLQIGHAYFLEKGQPITDFEQFARVIQEDIIPLLEEYCYEDYLTLEKILKSGLVDVQEQRIRHELFEDANHEQLIQALKQVNPDIFTATQAVITEVAQEVEQDDTNGV